MKKLYELSTLLIACVCIQQSAGAQPAQETVQAKQGKSPQTAQDSTSKNRRDKICDNMTADNASNFKGDIDIARRIRKSIMATKGLSVNAQNVKIITKHGMVTLRGPVNNDNEKSLIDRLAKNCPSVRSCTNQLEVEGQNSRH
jgi:hyperosmotically inducible periplasmic protein